MSKEVAKKETSAMTIPDAFKKKGAGPSVIDRADMLIPKLLVMQGLSNLVAEGRASMGDVVNSVTGEKVISKGEWINFVPLMTFKTVEYYNTSAPGKPKRERVEPWSATKHTNTDWEQVIEGVKFRVMETLNFYVFLEKDLSSPAALPYLIKFQSTQRTTGKKLITHFMQMEMMQAEPWFGVLALTTNVQKNDKGVFAVPDIKPVGQTDAKYAPKIAQWIDVISKGAVVVDDSDEDDVAETRTVNTKPTSPQTRAEF